MKKLLSSFFSRNKFDSTDAFLFLCISVTYCDNSIFFYTKNIFGKRNMWGHELHGVCDVKHARFYAVYVAENSHVCSSHIIIATKCFSYFREIFFENSFAFIRQSEKELEISLFAKCYEIFEIFVNKYICSNSN